MNTLVGKIFEDRKNSNRKVVVKDYQVSANDIEVVTIEFLDGCGKKAGTVENKFLKSFKKSWKETDEVIEETVEEVEQVEEVVENKLVPMPGIEKLAELKEEYSTEKEENITDEDYAKIDVEIAKQDKHKSRKSSVDIDIKIDEVSSVVASFGLDIKTYSGRLNNLNIKKDGKNVLEICVKRNRLVIYSKNELSIDCEQITNGKYKAFIEYTENYTHEVNKLLGGI